MIPNLVASYFSTASLYILSFHDIIRSDNCFYRIKKFLLIIMHTFALQVLNQNQIMRLNCKKQAKFVISKSEIPFEKIILSQGSVRQIFHMNVRQLEKVFSLDIGIARKCLASISVQQDSFLSHYLILGQTASYAQMLQRNRITHFVTTTKMSVLMG